MLENKSERAQLKNLLTELTNIQPKLTKIDCELTAITASLKAALSSHSSPHIFKQPKKDTADLPSLVSRIERYIKKIEKKLSQEISSVETEMHGVQIYSDYERKKIKHCIDQQYLKNLLKQIAQLIHHSTTTTLTSKPIQLRK